MVFNGLSSDNKNYIKLKTLSIYMKLVNSINAHNKLESNQKPRSR
jgi:hypothetical protein